MAYLPFQMTLNSYIDTKMGFLYSFPDLTKETGFTLLRQNAPWLATGMNGEESPPKL